MEQNKIDVLMLNLFLRTSQTIFMWYILTCMQNKVIEMQIWFNLFPIFIPTVWWKICQATNKAWNTLHCLITKNYLKIPTSTEQVHVNCCASTLPFNGISWWTHNRGTVHPSTLSILQYTRKKMDHNTYTPRKGHLTQIRCMEHQVPAYCMYSRADYWWVCLMDDLVPALYDQWAQCQVLIDAPRWTHCFTQYIGHALYIMVLWGTTCWMFCCN